MKNITNTYYKILLFIILATPKPVLAKISVIDDAKEKFKFTTESIKNSDIYEIVFLPTKIMSSGL